MKNLLDLLIYFRSNEHIFLANIHKVFLMIKLKIEQDKNRFYFFMKDGDVSLFQIYYSNFWICSQSLYPQFSNTISFEKLSQQ